MAPYLELLLVVIAVFIGTAMLVRHALVSAGLKRHLHDVEVRFACPKTASNVDCVLVEDTVSGRCARVKACSAFGAGGAPLCEQHCVELINIGVSLRAKDDSLASRASSKILSEVSFDATDERLHES